MNTDFVNAFPKGNLKQISEYKIKKFLHGGISLQESKGSYVDMT